jgi:hypothetical protein
MILRATKLCVFLLAIFTAGEVMAQPARLDGSFAAASVNHSFQLAYGYCKAVRGAKGKGCRWDFRLAQCFCPG